MTTTIGDRIALVRGSMSQSAFAKKLGVVHKNTIGNYERGDRTPDAQFLAALVKMGINANWLLTGEGEMLIDGQQTTNPDEFAYVTRWNVEVSAGHGASDPLQEVKLEDVAFRKDWLNKQGLNPKELAIFTARGDSMEPTIEHNDMLLIKVFPQWRHETAPDEGIYIIRIDGHLHAKRIQSDGLGGILVKSDNQAYDTIRIDKNRLPEVDIVGRVVWIGRSMNG